jgi:hypothetical protein
LHEYTARVPDDLQTEADFVALFEAIQASEVFERFGRQKKNTSTPATTGNIGR